MKLLDLSEKINKKQKLAPAEINYLLKFKGPDSDPWFVKLLKNSALPLSLFLGFLIAVYPEFFDEVAKTSPSWTNLSPRILAGVDYLWDIIGDPVGKQNLIFHLPNIVFYSFGILGIKKLFDSLNRKSWLDEVLEARDKLKRLIINGRIRLKLKTGASVLFVGKGDFIGMQFAINKTGSESVTISEVKPVYTNIWNSYSMTGGFEDLKRVIKRVGDDTLGEYMFFPVKDDQIFLPAWNAYDLPPHKLDLVCQDIRNIEKSLGWNPKRILIVGDKFHRSYVRSEDKKNVIKGSHDVISLKKIAKKYPNTTVIDPTDIVLDRILEIANGRKIVFRATNEGIREYKQRFYKRLEEHGYKGDKSADKGILTIGYDLFEDQTEQQTLSRRVDDYYPVVLSKGVYDSLIRNGYKKEEILYVPEIVLSYLEKVASEQ